MTEYILPTHASAEPTAVVRGRRAKRALRARQILAARAGRPIPVQPACDAPTARTRRGKRAQQARRILAARVSRGAEAR